MFRTLPAHLRAQMESIFRIRHLSAGEAVFHQGDTADRIYFVLDGRVHLERVDHDGHQTLLCRHAAGDCFCPLAILDQGPQLGTARAITPVTLLWAPKDEFLAMCDEHPEILRWLHGKCFRHVRHIVQRMEVSMFHDARERLILALVDHARRDENGQWVVRATHQELAQWIGTSRETVSRELAALRRAGLVRSGRGRVVLLDIQRLRARLAAAERAPQA
ncbi:MAG: Crp/Fnr family transcriptional regulator [Chloroflexi bacterium]|nr:Crp/Fnr family transcriptional regulator [Chloroflexota bacterium]